MSEQQEIRGYETCEFNCEICRISYSDIEQKNFCNNNCFRCIRKRSSNDTAAFKPYANADSDPGNDSTDGDEKVEVAQKEVKSPCIQPVSSSDENSSANEYEDLDDDVEYVEHVYMSARVAMASFAGSYCHRRNEFAVNELKRTCRKFSRSVKRLNKVVECKEKTLSHFHRELSPVSSDDEDVVVLN